MIFLFPLGHEVRLKRLPVVTVGLIALNVIAFFLTYFTMTSQFETLRERQVELIRDGMSLVFEEESNEGDPFGFLFTLPEFKKRSHTPEEALEFISEKLDPSKSSHRIWLEKFDDIKSFRQNMLIMRVGFVPEKFPSPGLITHIFVHAGWFHIIFNMWFLYLVGCCMEEAWGRWLFGVFYITGGIIAALNQFAVNPESVTPMIGASGAVAAAMGAFAVRYSRERIKCLLVGLIFIRPVMRICRLPAWLLLLLWFLVQVFFAQMYAGIGEQSGVAYFAHAGGFFFGLLFAGLIKITGMEKKIQPEQEEPEETLEFRQDPAMVAALDFMNKGVMDAAMAKINQVIGRNPDNLDAMLVKARILLQKESPEQSRSAFLEVLRKAKVHGDREMLVSVFEEYRGKFGVSEVYPDVLISAGRACMQKGRGPSAIAAFSQVLDRDDDGERRAKALFFCGKAWLQCENQEGKARECFQTFLRDHPEHPWAPQAQALLNDL